jgi:hypothetical protein
VSDYIGSFTSTALISGYNLGKPIIIFNPFKEQSYLPITHRKGVFEVNNYKDLKESINYLKNHYIKPGAPIGLPNGNSAEIIYNLIKKNLS